MLAQKLSYAFDAIGLLHFKFQTHSRRFNRRSFNFFAIKIAVYALQIFHFQAFYFDFLDQLLIISIKCIKNINHIMFILMRSGLIDAEKRIKTLHCFLRNIACQLLRFVDNQNRISFGNNINRLA